MKINDRINAGKTMNVKINDMLSQLYPNKSSADGFIIPDPITTIIIIPLSTAIILAYFADPHNKIGISVAKKPIIVGADVTDVYLLYDNNNTIGISANVNTNILYIYLRKYERCENHQTENMPDRTSRLCD
jgi:hypothetical protein